MQEVAFRKRTGLIDKSLDESSMGVVLASVGGYLQLCECKFSQKKRSLHY